MKYHTHVRIVVKIMNRKKENIHTSKVLMKKFYSNATLVKRILDNSELRDHIARVHEEKKLYLCDKCDFCSATNAG